MKLLLESSWQKIFLILKQVLFTLKQEMKLMRIQLNHLKEKSIDSIQILHINSNQQGTYIRDISLLIKIKTEMMQLQKFIKY